MLKTKKKVAAKTSPVKKIKFDKLEPRFKELWIKALRSGKYNQGKFRLKKGGNFWDSTEDKYCCIGVACDVYFKKILKKKSNWIYSNFFSRGKKSSVLNGLDSNMPEKIKEKINLSLYAEAHLISLNDDKDADFIQIANFIEKYL